MKKYSFNIKDHAVILEKNPKKQQWKFSYYKQSDTDKEKNFVYMQSKDLRAALLLAKDVIKKDSIGVTNIQNKFAYKLAESFDMSICTQELKYIYDDEHIVTVGLLIHQPEDNNEHEWALRITHMLEYDVKREIDLNVAILKTLLEELDKINFIDML